MTTSLILTQLLNGIQLGSLLFLMSAGLTLVFGIMNFVNLMHGSLFMMGAYFAAAGYQMSGSFAVAALAAIAGGLVLGIVVERLVVSLMYRREHLDQVLVTFGMVLFFNEVARIVWGPSSVHAGSPAAFNGSISLAGAAYPTYRLLIIAVAFLVGALLYVLIHRTRIGMLVRAGASRPDMVSAAIGGLMAGPITSVQPGMGEPVLIMTLVVIVTGGIGSIRGAFYGAMIIGIVDTVGRAFLPMLLREIFERSVAQAAGPALASVLIYLFMAGVLALRPNGLFPVRHG
jgi:branched-chain amino acid transport system permease protein